MGYRSAMTKPSAYKLGIKPNGEPVLLGAIQWIEHNDVGVPVAAGEDWEPIETVRLNDKGEIL